MRNNFERSARFVLKQEVGPGRENDGDLHTDPGDPGGTTRFGLSQRAYPKLDLTKIDYDGAMKIYLERWISAGCDDLPWPLDIMHFDEDFNMKKSAVKYLSQFTDPLPRLLHRILVYWYMNPRYTRDWTKRVLNLWQEISQ